MAFVTITPAQIEVGEAVKKELLQKIKDTLDEFNVDIEALKQTGIIDVFDIRVSGSVDQYTSSELSSRVPVFKAPVSATIVSFVATLLTASTSGTLEFELELSSDNGVNWTPLLSSPVQLIGTTVGSLSGTVNWVDVPSQSFDQGDLLRVRTTGVQVGQGNFHLSIYAELA
jgi:hypothetical protein